MLLNWGLAMMSAPNPLGIPDITSFLKQVFGQAAFCFPTQNANLISALQTAFSLAEICWRNQNQWGDIRLAKLDSADARFADQAPTADLLRQAFEQGHSIVVADVQTKNGLFATLCRQLSRQFACPTRCSAYWSPSYSEGQALQYDDQDAFVVQVSGSNNWQVDFNSEFRPFGGEAY
ncbi:MAG: cupin domain-containing protein, partial [Porticoccaceae bacterium]|nr:cupin domain-containing protein [Porticoccaceae bacterium]